MMWEERYLITENLRTAVRNSGYSRRELSRKLQFEVKNVYINKSIYGKNFRKLAKFISNWVKYPAACCAQFEIRDFRLEAERNTPSACCGDSEGLGNLFINFNEHLEKIKFDFTSNLGTRAKTEPIRKLIPSEDLAELFGIILGDGSVYRNTLKIAFDKRNANYIDYSRRHKFLPILSSAIRGRT